MLLISNLDGVPHSFAICVVFEHSPTGLLSGVLLHLRVPSAIEALSGRLIGLLECSEADAEVLVGRKASASDLEDDPLSLSDARALFRRRLQDELYRSEPLVRSRVKLVLARFCAVSLIHLGLPFCAH